MIYVHIAQGFEEIEALTTVDILRRADVPVQTVSITDERMVVGAHAIKIKTDITFEEADYENCEMIVLPGGLLGATNLRDHEGLTARIKQFNAEGRKIAAICASPAMVLAYHGILGCKSATMYPGLECEMGDAKVLRDGAVKDGNIITGRGPAFATEFALTILEELRGKDAAEGIAEDFLYERD